MNVGIILAGGVGARFGGDIPKQYLKINGEEVISYSYKALRESVLINEIIIVASKGEIERLKKSYDVEVVTGGNTRNKSLKNGLDYINANYNCNGVMIVEAARPMLTKEIVDKYLLILKNYDAVITGQKIVDSLGCTTSHFVDREEYYLIQAPEAFKFRLLYKYFDPNSKITATNQQIPENSNLYINFDFANNKKITYFEDLEYCQRLMSRGSF